MRLTKIVKDALTVFKDSFKNVDGVGSVSVGGLDSFLKNFKFLSDEYLFAICIRYFIHNLAIINSSAEGDDSYVLETFRRELSPDIGEFLSSLETYKYLPPILGEVSKYCFSIYSEACDVFLGVVDYELNYKDSMACLLDLLGLAKNMVFEYRDSEDICNMIQHEIDLCKLEIRYIEGDKGSKTERLQSFIIDCAFEMVKGRKNE